MEEKKKRIDCSSCSFKACASNASCENCTGFEEIKNNAFYRDFISVDFFDEVSEMDVEINF